MGFRMEIFRNSVWPDNIFLVTSSAEESSRRVAAEVGRLEDSSEHNNRKTAENVFNGFKSCKS